MGSRPRCGPATGGLTPLDAAAHTQTSFELPPLAGAFNFARHVIELNALRADKVAYVDDVGELTYGELSLRIRRFGDSLHKLGLRSEQRILLLLPDGNDWPVAFLGALHAGIVPIPVNTLLTATDYAYMIDHSGASAAIVSCALLATLREALSKVSNTSCHLIIVAGSSSSAASNHDGPYFADEIARGDSAYAGVSTQADAIAFWLYSSGSTGRPKGVVHTHANLYWTSELYAKRVLGITEGDTVFSAAKLFFAYGLGNAITFPLSVGATTILMAERPTPDAVFARLQQHKPTIFCGAPTLYAGMLASAKFPARDSVALRLCTSAGEALPREIGMRFAAHFGCDIIDGLGSTEMLHIFLSNRPGDVRYGTTGKPVDGYEIDIRDELGGPVRRGDIGDLWVKGPTSALMYWNDRTKSRETFHGPWLRTGDKYIRQDDGYFVYAGRNDDMLKISGQYVSPFEVESVLMQHQSVFESAVIGVTDAVGICKCKAYVVLRQDAAADESLATELQLFVKARLAPFKRPHYIEFVPDLPKTATGKIQRFKLRALSD
jgi:benzoate-CoA ligase